MGLMETMRVAVSERLHLAPPPTTTRLRVFIGSPDELEDGKDLQIPVEPYDINRIVGALARWLEKPRFLDTQRFYDISESRLDEVQLWQWPLRLSYLDASGEDHFLAELTCEELDAAWDSAGDLCIHANLRRALEPYLTQIPFQHDKAGWEPR